jgi:hypothetical protein
MGASFSIRFRSPRNGAVTRFASLVDSSFLRYSTFVLRHFRHGVGRVCGAGRGLGVTLGVPVGVGVGVPACVYASVM